MEYVRCNLCGADDTSPCTRVGEFQVVVCRRCGLFYTNPRASAGELPHMYSEDYFVSQNPSQLGYDDYSTHADGLRRVSLEHLEIIEQFVAPPASILDIGCAFGYFLEVARARNWNAEGVEISAFASKKAEEHAGVRVHTGTVREAGLAPSSYDVVTMWDMLEHSLDPAADLSETHRILTSGGYLFMTLPNAGSLPARIMRRHWYGFKSAAEHNYFFSKDTISRILSKTGFTLLEVRPGVWPCSMRFLVTKLKPYSATIYRIAERMARVLGIEDRIVRFRFIDMFVIARKNDTASEGIAVPEA